MRPLNVLNSRSRRPPEAGFRTLQYVLKDRKGPAREACAPFTSQRNSAMPNVNTSPAAAIAATRRAVGVPRHVRLRNGAPAQIRAVRSDDAKTLRRLRRQAVGRVARRALRPRPGGLLAGDAGGPGQRGRRAPCRFRRHAPAGPRRGGDRRGALRRQRGRRLRGADARRGRHLAGPGAGRPLARSAARLGAPCRPAPACLRGAFLQPPDDPLHAAHGLRRRPARGRSAGAAHGAQRGSRGSRRRPRRGPWTCCGAG